VGVKSRDGGGLLGRIYGGRFHIIYIYRVEMDHLTSYGDLPYDGN